MASCRAEIRACVSSDSAASAGVPAKQKNAAHPDYKTTVFHCFILAIGRMIKERPKMNRFIQGRRMYERYDISLCRIAVIL